MINSITIELENCSDVYKSKNSKKNIKKYIKKLLENLDCTDYLDTLNNHKTDIRKYFNQSLQISFKLSENNLTLFAKKLTDKDINKIKLNQKLKNIQNKKNYSAEKKEATKKFNEEKKKLNSDSRINPFIKKLYYKVKHDMPDADIPTPIKVLDDLDNYKKLFTNYIKCANEKIDIERYILLTNNYAIYMSFMTKIDIEIPDDLEARYKTNNMKF